MGQGARHATDLAVAALLCRAPLRCPGRRRAADGSAELTSLYDALNPPSGLESFEPHITLGLFERSADAEQVARIVERQHLPMHGRIEELALLRRNGDALDTLTTLRLRS